uniref:Coenzyme F390 synthetase n=1 Tax=uncultured bacterium CSL11 TaxID=1091566 RepID=G4WVE2_9BACT|nr:coenzyme F390 synthetase [uncultured bacterium CSL11]
MLEKSNTFQRFRIEDLLAQDVGARDVASILTSSGRGRSGFALGLGTRAQALRSRWAVDVGLDLAFDVDRRRTLLINCLPMGVTFQSTAVCIANVSVREDMACAIVAQAGNLFDQLIVCGDPLFLKRLCDFSEAKGTDWNRHRVHVIVGEETFSESFRDYLARTLHIDLDTEDGGLVASSMGSAELGLNLFHETRETIGLRRACRRDPRTLERLLGNGTRSALPTFLVYNPLHLFVEVISDRQNAAGDLVVTVLDRSAPVPLMRYRIGDRAQIVDPARIAAVLGDSRSSRQLSSFPMIALHGRSDDELPSGWHVDNFKDALYTRRELARHLTGAFRVSPREKALQWEVQLARDSTADPSETAIALGAALPPASGREIPRVVCYRYDQFEYGRTLDYERKFVYWQE